MNIDSKHVRAVLKAEKRKLRDNRARDFKDNRARFSAATEDSVSRVLMLEELLDGSAPSEDGALDLQGGGT